MIVRVCSSAEHLPDTKPTVSLVVLTEFVAALPKDKIIESPDCAATLFVMRVNAARTSMERHLTEKIDLLISPLFSRYFLVAGYHYIITRPQMQDIYGYCPGYDLIWCSRLTVFVYQQFES
jgi:hypothetical protein